MSSISNIEIEQDLLYAQSSDLDFDEVECFFTTSTPDKKIFSIKGHCRELRGKRDIKLDSPLPLGDILFTHMLYRGMQDKPDIPLRSCGVGLMLHVTNEKGATHVSAEGKIDPKMGFAGEGTVSKPYLINCDDDMMHLQGLVNNDNTGKLFKNIHFKQTTDIDMSFACRYISEEYGWTSIGYKNTFPFRGFYHGDGRVVRNLKMYRPGFAVGGLFGCLYNASIDSLYISGANITIGASGGIIAGCAVSAANDHTGGNPAVNSQIHACRVINSHLTCPVAAGMIIGMVDLNARLYVTDCSVDSKSAIVREGIADLNSKTYGVGGYVGLGALTSFVCLENLENEIPVSGSLGGIGGLIGTSDTLLVVNCRNRGEVSLKKRAGDNEEHMGTGGIAGGTGCAQFLNCENWAVVKGNRGTGGLLGSALITKGNGTLESPGYYNNVLFCCCTNQKNASISGTNYTGGLCGEAQTVASSSSNYALVTSTEDYAGGFCGSSPVCGFYDCMNAGNISAEKMAGGINGFSIASSITMTVNFGEVTTKGDYSGGILGLGGGGNMIHYCGNYGKISGANYVGGVVGEMGKVREWSAIDIITITWSSFSVITTISNFALFASSFGVVGREAIGASGNLIDVLKQGGYKNMVKINTFFTWEGFVETAINYFAFGTYDIYSRITRPSSYERDQRLYKSNLMDASMKMRDKLHAEMRERMSKASWKTPNWVHTLAMNGAQTDAFMAQLGQIGNDSIKLKNLNDNIDLRRDNLKMEAEEYQRKKDLACDIINGVLAPFGIGFMIASIAVSAGTTAPFAIAAVSGVISLLVAANSITSSAMNYQVNSTEISQVFNYGEVQASGYSGGIAGSINDYGKVYDSYNAGSYKSESYGAIAGYAGNRVVIANTLNYSSKESRLIFRNEENFLRIEGNQSINDQPKDSLTRENSDIYKTFNFRNFWSKPKGLGASQNNTYILPILNKSQYENKPQ